MALHLGERIAVVEAVALLGRLGALRLDVEDLLQADRGIEPVVRHEVAQHRVEHDVAIAAALERLRQRVLELVLGEGLHELAHAAERVGRNSRQQRELGEPRGSPIGLDPQLMQQVVVGPEHRVDGMVVAQAGEQRGLHHRLLVDQDDVRRLGRGPARGRDGERCPRHGRARRRLQQRSAPQRLERLAPGGVERRDVEVLVVELHVAPLALGVGAVPGEADAEQHRQGGVAAGHAGGVDAIGEPRHRACGKERDHERDEVAAVVAPDVAHRRPGAEIEEDVVGVQDHVHGRALGRGRDDDHHDQRRRQGGCEERPAGHQGRQRRQRQGDGHGEQDIREVAFVDPEVSGQDARQPEAVSAQAVRGESSRRCKSLAAPERNRERRAEPVGRPTV